ncbi:hypothetical protein ACHAW6_009777 [Cyclotella cf. meneghiniana]
MTTHITRPATSFLDKSDSFNIVPAVPCSLDPATFKSAPTALQTGPRTTLQPHGVTSVSRSVTQESLLEQEHEVAASDDELQGLSLDATIDSDFISDPFYRITPPPSIEGRQSPLLFAASFQNTAKDAAGSPSIVTPQPSDNSNNMSSLTNFNNNSEAAPASISLPQPPATTIAAPPTAVKPHLNNIIHNPPAPISIPRTYTKQPPAPSPNNGPPSPASENTGRWTAEEHRLFLQGLEEHGKGWKKIASLIQTRTVVQIRTHAQKYFQKLAKARANGDADLDAVDKVVPPPSANGAVVMRTLPNMTLGTDSVSMAAAAGQIGTAAVPAPGRKRKTNAQGTKRKAIGSVVRSSVREGRNWKRQKMLEDKLNGQGKAVDIPNPLPSISKILDPYVMAPPVPGAGLSVASQQSAEKTNTIKNRGRQQLVNTATHGTLPMAALEDAVFRLLTPAPGTTSHTSAQPSSNPSIVDPLAPNPVKISVASTMYPPGQAVAPGQPGAVVPNSSPTCVTDMSSFPSWVDVKNPPAWYNEGADIDTLLEEAECLNWLSDTGDLDETYPPAVAMAASAVVTEPSMDYEPTPVNVHPYEYAYHGNMDSHDAHTTLSEIPEESIDPTLVHDPITHPSVESLSFLVDSPKEGMDEMTSFLNDEHNTHHTAQTLSYASAPEADEAVSEAVEAKLSAEESHGNLMSFPDLDMGDEHAFVSALLDTSKESVISFSKWGSQIGVAEMAGVLDEDGELHL